MVGVDVILAMLLVRLGQMLLLCGAVRSKNAAEAAVRLLLDLSVAVLALWAVGAAIDPADTGLRGHPVFALANVFGQGGGIGFYGWGVAVLVASGAIASSTGERAKLSPVLTLGGVCAAALVPFAAAWMIAGHGLSIAAAAVGVAGIAGGAAGLTLARQAGPRQGKFNRDGSANLVPGHSLAWQPAGLLLIAGGLAFVAGFSLILGLAAAVLAAAGYGRVRFGKIDLGLLVGGGMAGVIAATASAGVPVLVRPWLDGGATAVLAGALAGVVTPWLMLKLEGRWRIDDVAGFGSAGLVGGTIGLVAGVVLQRPASGAATFGLAVRVLLVILGTDLLAVAVAWLVGRAFAKRGGLRISSDAEYEGLDLTGLDLNAYPDFQQTMIKSHHLRQL